MNFLAHIYLSGDNDDLKIGNFMADSIKGKGYKKYSGDLKNGILIHRKIDAFTDRHPLVQKSTHRLFKRFRHYNGVINDVFYDHFLAKNWPRYSGESLSGFVQDFYQLLGENLYRTPKNIQDIYPIMVREDWLYSYREVTGIEKILRQMSHHSIKHGFQLDKAVKELREYYPEYEEEFSQFFPQIINYIKGEIQKLNRPQ